MRFDASKSQSQQEIKREGIKMKSSILKTGCVATVLTLLGATPANAGVTTAEHEARDIVQRIRATRPSGNSSAEGVFKVFNGRKLQATIPFKSEVIVTATNWLVNYRTLPSSNSATAELLQITRVDGAQTYAHSGTTAGLAVAMPFAGSDFLGGDLGLEFLNWPGQRLLKKELRSSQSCYVIESTNPVTNSMPYSRVVTWLDIDSVRDFGAPAIVHADAYDLHGKLLKEFGPKDFKKVDGEWQVEEMQMENLRTGTKTKIEFRFDRKPAP
jgi:hypothetical protein